MGDDGADARTEDDSDDGMAKTRVDDDGITGF